MKKQCPSFLLVVLICSLILNGCGGNSGGVVLNIPQVTAPVVTSRASLNFPHLLTNELNGIRKIVAPNQTRGVKASDWGDSGFWTGKSGVLCETGSHIIDLIGQANEVDFALCFVKAAAARGSLSNFSSNRWNYYKRDEFSDFRIKVKAETEGGAVKDFKMYTCNQRCDGCKSSLHLNLESGAQGSVYNYPTNSIYNNGTDYSELIDKARLQISGTVDSNSNWLTKTITANSYRKSTYGTPADHEANYKYERGHYAEISQFSDYITAAGKLRVANSGSSNETRDISSYGKLGIVNYANLRNLEFDGGSSKLNGTIGGTQNVSLSNQVRSWNSSGTPITPATGVSNYDDVQGVDLSTISSLNKTMQQISDAGEPEPDENWDCEPEAGSSFETFSLAGDNSEISVECGQQYPQYVSSWGHCEDGSYENPVR